LRNPFWGKLLGGAAGFATGRVWLGLIGVLLGHQFDRGFAERIRPGGREDARATVLPKPFLEALFQTMGHLAKADGRVTEAEIRAARSLMQRLNLDPGQVRDAMDFFEKGKSRSFPLLEQVRRLHRETERKPELRAIFVRLLTEVSLAKKTIAARERNLLWTVCRELEIGRVEQAQLEAMLRAQKAFRRSPAGEVDAERVTRAYTLLGVDRSSSNDEIKKAYRRLMNRHHPDKIAAHNPDSDELAAAEKRTRDIRAAYETLKSRRLIR
jgi:DnaJ like chaperone protein